MSDRNPTRAALLEMQDEHRAMREGWVFLDEKCLLLAGEMMRQLNALTALQSTLDSAWAAALAALQAALGRHGLEGLQLQPPASLTDARMALRSGSIMGVKLADVHWTAYPTTHPTTGTTALGATEGQAAEEPPIHALATPPAAAASPEARDARRALQALIEAAAPVAAVQGNLERLSQEYRRSVRRARALQDVLLPELGRDMAEIAGRIEELDQQDAIAMRHRSTQGPTDAWSASQGAGTLAHGA